MDMRDHPTEMISQPSILLSSVAPLQRSVLPRGATLAVCQKQSSPSHRAFCSIKAVLVSSDEQHQELEETREQEQHKHFF